jgi:hypothetical protein
MYITAHNYFLRRTLFIQYLNGDIKIITKLGRDILALPGFIISNYLCSALDDSFSIFLRKLYLEYLFVM